MLARVAAFARLHGVAPSSVYEWRDAGLISIVDGDIEVEAANQSLTAAGRSRVDPHAPLPEWLTNPDPPKRRGRPPKPKAPPAPVEERIVERVVERMATEAGWSLAEAHARTAAATAALREMEAAERRRELVPVREVAAAVAEELCTVRQRLQRLPADHAERLSRIRDAGEMRVTLDSMITAALRDLSVDRRFGEAAA